MHITSALEVVAFDKSAVRVSEGLVAQASAADLERPTPCAGWTLRDLLAHMTAQHYGFAAAAAGDGDLACWQPRPRGDDPAGGYFAAAEHVLAAFAADGVLDRKFMLPEISSGRAFPAPQAISFHFIDYVVHSWDVARTLGLPVRFEPSLLDAALAVAGAVPAGRRAARARRRVRAAGGLGRRGAPRPDRGGPRTFTELGPGESPHRSVKSNSLSRTEAACSLSTTAVPASLRAGAGRSRARGPGSGTPPRAFDRSTADGSSPCYGR